MATRLLLVCALSWGSVLAAQQTVPNSDFVVSRPVVNMYREANADSEVTSQVLYGTGVLSLEKHQDWIRIRTADGYTGWVSSADMKAQAADTYAAEGKSVRVTAISANAYREPDVTEHAPALRLPWESILEMASDSPKDNARWLKVRLVDGQTAWVQRGDVGEKSAPLSIDETLQVARRFLGTTYTWGGVSSFGFDCSGFTQMLVRQRGIEMPRDADLQAGWTGVILVDRKDLIPGDLLFFGSSASKITHTGMYLGRGEFIHDTTHDHPGVQISRLDDAPWTTLLVATRRVKQ
ncbi:MAG: C40 family peptidase [Acidobacteria bacterium]|nr:C40 family peptidase [Acidobacteriota bacterium]